MKTQELETALPRFVNLCSELKYDIQRLQRVSVPFFWQINLFATEQSIVRITISEACLATQVQFLVLL